MTRGPNNSPTKATRLAIESVEKGWGGPSGAVIVKDGKIIGHSLNRVLLTGIPIYHAEVTVHMIGGVARVLNTKYLIGFGLLWGGAGDDSPRPAGSPDPVPGRAKILKGCDIYINRYPCPMCMSAIDWARIDRVYFGTRLSDTSKIGFDDEFQLVDFKLPSEERRKRSNAFPILNGNTH